MWSERQVDARLREDLAKLPENHITLDMMKKLNYTPLFLKELLRLYSPVWTIARNIIEPDEVCGYDVPAAIKYKAVGTLRPDRKIKATIVQ
jgi:cytochrome P450